jgi:hypothetical protein
MEFDTFLGRFWDILWLFLFGDGALLCWIAAIRRVVKGQGMESLWPLLAASVLTATLVASDAIPTLAHLGR